jgi:hypothetical protein
MGPAGLFGRHAVAMWVLDPANSPALFEQLRPHGRDGEFDVAWVGEGWRSLVEECHTRIAATFPEYELLAIKQEYGVLEYQAFPRRSARDAAMVRLGGSRSRCHLRRVSDEIRQRLRVVRRPCRTSRVAIARTHALRRVRRKVPRPSLQGS